jgi:predicted Zn-dependent protease
LGGGLSVGLPVGRKDGKRWGVVADAYGMGVEEVLRQAEGWIEIGLGADALELLQKLPPRERFRPAALELKLEAEMRRERWNQAADTARLLCVKLPHRPDYFLRAARCLHATGDTQAAKDWLMSGPRELIDSSVFHYHMGCYAAALGEEDEARRFLARAFDMDVILREIAEQDEDLASLSGLP